MRVEFGPYVELEDWDDLPVWLLWMVPVTEEELQVAKNSGPTRFCRRFPTPADVH
jgi:hypothetical protein